MKYFIITLFITLFAMIEVTAKTTIQTSYRWRNDDGNEITASWKAPQNVPIYFEGTDVVRLRVQEYYSVPDFVLQQDEGEEISQYVFNQEISLFYSLEGDGIFRKITDDASSNAFALFSSGNVADLTGTTRQLTENLSYTWEDGFVYTSTYDNSHIIPVDHYTEYEWSIQPTVHATPGVYYFIKGWAGVEEVTALKDNGSYSFSTRLQQATMYYEVPMPAIPLSNWSIYSVLVLIMGFLVYRFWR